MSTLSRRQLLRGTAGLTMGSVLAGLPQTAAGGLLDLFRSRVGPTAALTPNEQFYVTSYRSPPSVDAASWRLLVRGLVEQPLTLTYQDFLVRPRHAAIVTLECVGNRVAGDAIGTARWEGTPLNRLLADAGLLPGAYDIVFRGADGYADSIRVERAMADDVLIAHQMNGVPLPQGHGFPARMIVPGVYGMKHVQWLTEIEVVGHDFAGYYQRQGWSDSAEIKTMSRIDLPEHGETIRSRSYTVRGLAFAGLRGIGRVELSLDAGTTWTPAALLPKLSDAAWVLWQFEWTIPAPGRYTLAVRAVDGVGHLQSEIEQDPFPDGGTGLHEITVTVAAERAEQRLFGRY